MRKRAWAGWLLSVLIALMLLMDAVFKFFLPPPVVTTFAQLGLPIALAVPIGALLIVCTILYVIPTTALVGAVLLTGYLGGAIVTNLRVGNPIFTHVLFPVYVGIIVWLGAVSARLAARTLVARLNAARNLGRG